MKKFMMAFVLAFAMVFSTFAGVNAAGSKTASLVLKKASKSGVVLSSKIVSKKGVAAKYKKKSVSVAKALKGQKVVKAKGVKLSKLKKLSKMVRIYRKNHLRTLK